jgi:ubiquinone/menaquinone biosynthesis C-methylase UbiE
LRDFANVLSGDLSLEFFPAAPTTNREDEMSEDRAAAFKGTFAELYDRYLVPMLFLPYARILADRASNIGARSILEIAAGTGVATQELARALPAETAITATDLSQPMIDIARSKPGMTNVVWQQADAMRLPFADDNFDLVVCQFGVMFFPDKRASFREASRVLRRGGSGHGSWIVDPNGD